MTKEIQTKPFGAMKIDERQILSFPEGILGFEKYNEFALIEENEESPFKWLQSLSELDLAFIVIQPDLFAPDYKPVIGQEDLETIQLAQIEEGVVMTIVTIPNDNPRMMTANLQGPVIINPKNRMAKQCISKNENHPLRKLILENVPMESV